MVPETKACMFSCPVMSDSVQPHGLCAHQAPLSMGFPRQEYWSGLLCSHPGHLFHPGNEPRSPALTGEGNGCPFQYSWLENPMDREAWWATVHEVAQSRIQLSNLAATAAPALAGRFFTTESPGKTLKLGNLKVKTAIMISF